LVETIAESINPSSLISKMGQLARVMVPSLALAVPGSAAGGRAGIVINLTVNVQGSASDGRKLVKEMMPEITKELDIYLDRRAYRSHK
jgi:hypothetical protein